MRQLWLLLLLSILLVNVPPVQAEIVVIDPVQVDEAYAPLLEPAEAERIAALQSAANYTILSPISPDDRAVFVVTTRPGGAFLYEDTFGFLDIQSGVFTAIPGFFERFAPLTNISWRNGTTASFLALDANALPVLTLIDRRTGEARTEPVSGLPGFPLSLAPNASRVLLALFPDPGLLAPPVMQSPFNLEVQLRPPQAEPTNRIQRMFGQHDGPITTLQVTSEELDLALYDLANGQTEPLATLPAGSGIVGRPAWSQDGSRLAFVRNTIGPLQRGQASLDNLATRDALGQLPPAENPLLLGNVVELFDLSGPVAQAARLSAAEGDGDVFGAVSWSTDGYTLLTKMLRPGRLAGRAYPIYLYPESSYVRFYNAETQRVIGVFDRPEITAPNFMTAQFVSPDEVIFNGVHGLSFRIYYYNRVSGEFRELSPLRGSYTQVLATRFSRQVVFVHSSFTRPPEIYRLGWDGEALAALTFNNITIEQLNRVQVHEVSFPLPSGAVRHGLLVQPADQAFPPKDIPIVFWQEGGPGLFMVERWGANVENPYNLLPNFGIAVLVLPLPGREGWGAAFYNGLAEGNNFGAIDIDEAAYAAQQLIARGYSSSQKLGLVGCSYGGYFTSQSIVRHPALYGAANTQCTLLDTITEWQTGFTALLAYLTGEAPTSNPQEYLRDSPAFQAARVRTPTLIFHGAFDFLPIAIAETFHTEIEEAGTPVRMIKFLEEGHGLFDPNNQLIAGQEQVNWFRHYLLGAPSAIPEAQGSPADALDANVLTTAGQAVWEALVDTGLIESDRAEETSLEPIEPIESIESIEPDTPSNPAPVPNVPLVPEGPPFTEETEEPAAPPAQPEAPAPDPNIIRIEPGGDQSDEADAADEETPSIIDLVQGSLGGE